jgi:ribonuclease HI
MAKKYLQIYTDGGCYKELNIVKWSFIVVENNEDIIQSGTGTLSASGGFDVERAESEALYRALVFCKENPDNYRIYTDSRSVLDKIENKVNNATRNPHIKGIQEILVQIKNSPYPCSVSLNWCKRRSNKWMQEVDDRCYKDYYEKVNLSI